MEQEGFGGEAERESGEAKHHRHRNVILPLSQGQVSSRWVLGNIGVVLAAMLFLITALALSGTAVNMLSMQARAQKVQVVMHECGLLVEQVANINAAARTYMTLRNPALIATREKIKPVVMARFATIKAQVAEYPDKVKAVGDAERTTAKRIKLFDEMIAKAGTPGMMVIEGEGERLAATQASNAKISAIRDWAEASFRIYQDRLVRDMHLSMILALISAVASPFFGLLGIHLLKLDRESMKQRELQLELMHVQRLAIMGETSAMLAHEINQPLTAAGNYLAVLRRQVESGNAEKAAGVVERVEAQIRRAALILKKLRRFIEKRESERDISDPEALVEDAISLLGTIDTTVSICTDITPGLPQVLVDRVQLQQVLVNLMRNAIEAMEGQDRRQLTLSLRPYGKGSIEIALADTGPGLDPDVAARLFQPFVSTKAAGMGVGLSICHSIISQHHGQIWAEANPQGGTVFRFTLPAAAQSVAA